jgi:broad specificity phosphatase PhoE
MGESADATLVLVRHGETLWNAEGRMQGHTDSPLTDRGREQRRLAAQRLARLDVAAVYSSDTGRARETGELIASPHGLTVEPREGLRERCYGVLEGLTLEEARQRDSEMVERWMADREGLAPPEGETQTEMSRRVMAAVRRIAARHPGETVVLSIHGGPIKSAFFEILQVPVSSWDLTWVANGSITVVRGTPRLLRVAAYNDTCHLGGEPRRRSYV